MLFEKLVEIVARYLHRKGVALQADRLDGPKPGLEALLTDFGRNTAEAAGPNRAKILEHEQYETKIEDPDEGRIPGNPVRLRHDCRLGGDKIVENLLGKQADCSLLFH